MNLERPCSVTAQYSRRQRLEITGIPSAGNDSDLEDVACRIVNKVGVAITDTDIEDCQRVGNTGQTTVKFARRKVSKQILSIKKDLSKITMENVPLTGGNKIYINQSLCLYYRMLWSKRKLLHRMGKIFAYYLSNGNVKTKIQENSRPLTVSHTSDSESHFPDADLNPPR